MNTGNKISKEFLTDAFHALSHGVIISDAQGQFVFVNKQAVSLFGSELERKLDDRWKEGSGLFEIDNKTPYDINKTPMARALKGEVVISEKIFVKTQNNPEGFYIKVCAYPIYNNSTLIAAIVTFEDITHEQKLYDNIINKISELENYLKYIMNDDFKRALENEEIPNT